MPENNAYARLQNALIHKLKAERAIRSRAVEAAFRAVPRHLFLPDVPPEKVYSDTVIPTKFEGEEAISSSSQPTMMAIMLEQANFKAGQRVLEIGAGTGYNAGMIAHLVRQRAERGLSRGVERAHVTTVDIDADLVAAARLGLDRAGYTDVKTICADGWAGYPPNAPYDRIVLTVRANDIAPAWFDQLTPDGRIILPLDLWAGAQYSIAFQRGQTRNLGDILISVSAHPCGFMPLRGASAQIGDEMQHLMGERIVISQFAHDGRTPLPLPQVFGLLKRTFEDYASGVSMSSHEFYGGGFWLWLAAQDASVCFVRAGGDWLARIPAFSGKAFSDKSNGDKASEVVTTAGLISERGLALLSRENAADDNGGHEGRRGAVMVRRWGEDDLPTRKLIAALRAWERAGRPTGDNLRVAAYPADRDVIAPRDTVLIRKPNFHYLLRWK